MTRENIEKYMLETYGCAPDYPWLKYPGYAVYRHSDNRKWFAVVMDLSKRKLGIQKDEIVDAMNVKCDPVFLGSLLGQKGIFPAYHMNKCYWLTIALDGSVEKEQIKFLIDMSFDLTKKSKKK